MLRDAKSENGDYMAGSIGPQHEFVQRILGFCSLLIFVTERRVVDSKQISY